MSGAFLLEKATGLVYCIKGYGVIDRKKCLGPIDSITGSLAVDYRYHRPWVGMATESRQV